MPRTLYLDKIKPFIDKILLRYWLDKGGFESHIFFFQIIDFLKTYAWVASKQIIFINKELYEFDSIRDDSSLLAYIEERKTPWKTYIFIDEAQIHPFTLKRHWDIFKQVKRMIFTLVEAMLIFSQVRLQLF